MENRFGVKDLFLFLLLLVVIIMVGLAMKQTDRQWETVQKIKTQLDGQQRDLEAVRNRLASGVMIGTKAGATQSGADTTEVDPFASIRRAEKMEGYAKGDRLVASFQQNIAKLTPLLSADLYADFVQSHVVDTLAARDNATADWVPLLASSWTTSADGLVITFTMREGVRFSDGEPVTPDDVVFSYQWVMDERVAAPRQRSYLERLKSVERKGANQVVFTFKEPYFMAFEQAALLQILPRHFYEKYTPEQFNQSVGLLMGSGPYRMEDPAGWKPGQLIQLVRNERYWGVQPAFDRVIYREFTNGVARQNAYVNGEIDVCDENTPDQYRDLLKNSAVVNRSNHFAYDWVFGGYRFIAWNQKTRDGKAPSRFADKRVRQAMTMLVDREKLVKEIQLGYATVATGPFSPQSKQCDPSIKPWPYDIEAARKLLADAGFSKLNDQGILLGPDGAAFDFKLTYPSGSANYEKMIIAVKDSFAKVGIHLQPDPLEWGSFTDRLNNKNFEAISLGFSSGIESDIYQEFHSDQMVAGGDDFMNYKSAELDSTIQEARRTIDESKRMELWRKCNRILADDQPYTFLWFTKRLDFLDKRIQNVRVEKLGINPLEEWFVPSNLQKRNQ